MKYIFYKVLCRKKKKEKDRKDKDKQMKTICKQCFPNWYLFCLLLAH